MTGAALVLAVDCSTTAAKAVLVDSAGHQVASASTPLTTTSPYPGHHEQQADDWWRATRASVQAVMAGLAGLDRLGGVDGVDRVRAMCITHQRESFVCLDSRGRALRPAILWLDTRASAEIAELGSERVLAISGKPPDTTPALYKLAWLARHESSVLTGSGLSGSGLTGSGLVGTVRVAEVHGYLAQALTGRWETSIASADSLGLLDLQAGTWSPELFALAGLRPDQLPGLVPPGTVLGQVVPDVAAELGLPAGLPLVAGIGDGQAAGLGAGVVEPGTAYLNLGTSMVLGTPSTSYLTGRAFRTLAGAPSGTFVLETVLNAATYLTDWFRRELGAAGSAAPDAALEAAAAQVPPGAGGLLAVPYWNAAQTPYWDPDARGALVGLSGAHTRAHVYRALLEGVAFEARLHLQGLEAATGVPITRICAMGGGSRSPLWTQIVADVTGRQIRLCEGEEISARGAAVLAWAGAGLGDLRDTALTMGRLGATVGPDPARTAYYDKAFAVQQQIYPGLRAVFTALVDLDPQTAVGPTSRTPR